MNAKTIDIATTIVCVVQKCFGIPKAKLSSNNWSQPLNGSFYHLSATDLVYLLFELEREFGIRIPPEFLSDYHFSSINYICNVIEECLEK